MANIIARKISEMDGREYRIVDDLPAWGGYYSIEVAMCSGGCTLWKMVWGCSKNLGETRREFVRLTAV